MFKNYTEAEYQEYLKGRAHFCGIVDGVLVTNQNVALLTNDLPKDILDIIHKVIHDTDNIKCRFVNLTNDMGELFVQNPNLDRFDTIVLETEDELNVYLERKVTESEDRDRIAADIKAIGIDVKFSTIVRDK